MKKRQGQESIASPFFFPNISSQDQVIAEYSLDWRYENSEVLESLDKTERTSHVYTWDVQ